MSIVLIFTNPKSWNEIDYDEYAHVKQAWKGLIPNDSRKVVECVLREGDSAKLENMEDRPPHDDGIYLVYDKMDQSSFDKLMEKCPVTDTIILVHTKGKWTIDTMPSCRLPNCKKGLHENYDDRYLYRPIYLILADNKGNKMQRVLDVLGWDPKAVWKAAAQVFMSGCMYPYNDDPGFLAAKDSLIANPALRELVLKFYEEIYPNEAKRNETPKKDRESYASALNTFCDDLFSLVWS